MDYLVMRMRRRAFKTMVKAYLPTIPLIFIQVNESTPDVSCGNSTCRAVPPPHYSIIALRAALSSYSKILCGG